MLLSLFGEIGFVVIGALYVLDCWFDSFVSLLELMNDKNEKDDEKDEMSESARRMYS